VSEDEGEPGISGFLRYEFTVIAFTVYAFSARLPKRKNGQRNNGKLKTQKGPN
jgi:hypothetical protein